MKFLGVLAAKMVQKKSGLLIGDGMSCLFTRAFTRKLKLDVLAELAWDDGRREYMPKSGALKKN